MKTTTYVRVRRVVGLVLAFGAIPLAMGSAVPPPQHEPFDFVEAWGVIPVDGETGMALLPPDGACDAVAPNGESCVSYLVGMSHVNAGDVSPVFEMFGVLDDVHIRQLPDDVAASAFDLADLDATYPPATIAGTAVFQDVLIAGTLITPAGYSRPVSGVLTLNELFFTSPEPVVVGTMIFVPDRAWQSLDDAIADVDEQADQMWYAEYQPVSGGESPRPRDLLDFTTGEDCLAQLNQSMNACNNQLGTAIGNAQITLDGCLDQFGFWDWLKGGVAGGAAGGIGGGGIGLLIGGPGGVGVGGAAGAVGGFVPGMFIAYFDNKADCYRQATTSLKIAQNNFANCVIAALQAFNNCIGDFPGALD